MARAPRPNDVCSATVNDSHIALLAVIVATVPAVASPAHAESAAAAPGAAIATRAVTAAQLPRALKPKTAVAKALEWQDANGTNYLVVTGDETQGDDERSEFLTVTHAACRGTKCRTLRTIRDSVEHCGQDLTLELDPGSISVTDLDGNGFSEVSFVYRLACAGDSAAADIKVMLLEKGAKYAIRGSDIVIYDGKSSGGVMKPDRAAFAKAPPAFAAFATALYKKSVKTIRP
jgi:hypothetical protein